jgi:protein Mpv17
VIVGDSILRRRSTNATMGPRNKGSSACCWLLYFLIGRSIVSATGFVQHLHPRTAAAARRGGGSAAPTAAAATAHNRMVRVLRGGATAPRTMPSDANVVTSLISQLRSAYAENLSRNPILTKSVTAGVIFALSDYIAQRAASSSSSNANGNDARIDQTRLAVSAAVGLFYFGPAAHYWYDWMFRLFPATNLPSTLSKAAMGQTLFGPTFTCIFFATGLWQAGQLTWRSYVQKLRRDLPNTWLTGAAFWITVDLFSYSYLPVPYIPLFVNVASLIWTTYLVLKSYGGGGDTASATTTGRRRK